MSAEESQQEEREVLLSIYEGDDHFFDISSTQYQYKVGEDGSNKSVMIEVVWGEAYPDELPSINLDIFYNKHLVGGVKSHIKQVLTDEANELIGCGSTYTLFEYAKENMDSLLESQPEVSVTQTEVPEPVESVENDPQPVKQKKEQLSKNQKRRLYDKFGTQGMMQGKQRGWDWVDVVKHLSQTGVKPAGE